jgi:hypothetical protein
VVFASFVLKAIHFRTTGTSHSVLGNCLDLLLAKMKRAHVVPEGALADAGGAAIRAAHSDSWVQFPACVSGVEVSIVQEKPRFRVTYRSRCEDCNRRQDLVTWSNNLCSYPSMMNALRGKIAAHAGHTFEALAERPGKRVHSEDALADILGELAMLC